MRYARIYHRWSRIAPFRPKIGVAVSKKPEGPYEFLGHIRDPSGGVLGMRPGDVLPFDPGVLADWDGSVHLYEGQAPRSESQIRKEEKTRRSPWHVELEPDMVRMKTEPTPVIPSLINSAGTGFESHEFFEDNSIRRFGDRYYFIYSSVQAHELCWAVSDRPDGGFRFGGTLVSNGDIGFHGPAPVSFGGKASRAIRNYIANLRNGATAVFKYSDFDGGGMMGVTVRGKYAGRLLVRDAEDGAPLAALDLKPAKTWTTFHAPFCPPKGQHPLYFTYEGKGTADFLSFELVVDFCQDPLDLLELRFCPLEEGLVIAMLQSDEAFFRGQEANSLLICSGSQ